MNFTELDLTKIPDLNWTPLLVLRTMYLDVAAKPRMTYLQAFSELSKRKEDRRNRLALVNEDGATAQNLLDEIRECDEQRAILDKKLDVTMREDGQHGAWVGVGSRGLDMQHEIIPQRHWAHLRFEFEDSAACSGEVRFSGIRFLVAAEIPEDHEIRKLIEAAQDRPLLDPQAHVSGSEGNPADNADSNDRGRPSAKYEILREFFFRVMRGEIEKSQADQGRVLHAWLKREHPNKPNSDPKTIAGQLKDEFKAAQKWLGQKTPKNY